MSLIRKTLSMNWLADFIGLNIPKDIQVLNQKKLIWTKIEF